MRWWKADQFLGLGHVLRCSRKLMAYDILGQVPRVMQLSDPMYCWKDVAFKGSSDDMVREAWEIGV